jgi:hypothetical protein
MEKDLMTGKFGTLLKRSNKQLREDRGRKIVSTTEKLYRRKVEDLQDELETLQIDRDNLLDINPSNTQSIINPSDFQSQQFVERDMKLGLAIRETSIKLEVAREAYTALFSVDVTKTDA